MERRFCIKSFMIIEIHACGSGLHARAHERVFMMDFITVFNFVLEYALRNGPERKSVIMTLKNQKLREIIHFSMCIVKLTGMGRVHIESQW